MRADRLVATLLLMQARGRVTARELAEELEISVATARRDLEALSGAGVPVYPQPGRGGGWSLLGEGRTDLSGFTASEARALFLLLGPRAGESDAGRSALRKVLRALPATFRADAEAAADAVIVRPGGSETDAATLADLQHAVVEHRVVRFRYTAWGRPPRERQARPLGLVEHGAAWYLVAEAHGGDRDGERRTYRVDRVAGFEMLDERFEPPAEFSLDDAWREVEGRVGELRARASAVVLVDPSMVDEVRGWVGATTLEGVEADGRVRVHATAPAEEVLLRRLAAWAHVAEVVEPESLRAALAAAGAALVARYGAGPT
ncbi:YafY family protein [Agromyces sp. LHK192]|uniref:helix-turn-helix transcriptional regulator n=1 Tax=Agromyces sp. LHK192 TaxID=2498704 RepID=UPI000FD9C41D|nr:WYL domain-containing protein [Agromyces sp. LHK192]